MRWSSLLLALVLAGTPLLVAADGAADVTIVDRIVAVVDGRPITVVALRRRLAPALRRIQRSRAPAWQKAEWLRQGMAKALDQVIDEALIERAAEGLGVKIDGAAVDRAIDADAAGMGISRATLFDKRWGEDGSVEADVRAEYRRRLIEGYALDAAYRKTHDGSLPRGDGEPAARALAAWQTEWRASLRGKACIERRLRP